MNRQQRRAAARPDGRGAEDCDRLRQQVSQALAQGRPQAAAALLQTLTRLVPSDGRAWQLLAATLLQAGRTDASLAAMRRAAQMIADDPGIWTALGRMQQDQARLDDAIASFRRAIAVDPDFPGAFIDLAGALKERGNLAQALAAVRRAQALAPGDARAAFDLSLLLLTLGAYEEGWDAYEARMNIPDLDIHTGFPQPQWNGEDIRDKTLLVHAEQGLGDVIQFARYLPMLAGRAGRLLFAVPPSLAPLFADLPGVDALLTGREAEPSFDCHCPLLSLPRLMKTRAETIPATVPYLRYDDARVRAMAQRVPQLAEDGPKVGLVWAGGSRPDHRPAGRMDRQRSIPLKSFASLSAHGSALRFVSLQKGDAARQLDTAPRAMRLLDPMPLVDDFADTAAVIAHLDLVISVDTAVAHLAGALGKPVWIASRFDGCWRWLTGREDSPWYPTARLFRQRSPNDWASVIRCIDTELRKLYNKI